MKKTKGRIQLFTVIASIVLVSMLQTIEGKKELIAREIPESILDMASMLQGDQGNAILSSSFFAQPQPERRICEVKDHTPFLEAQFPNEFILGVRSLDDQEMRRFIVLLQQQTTPAQRWVIYDVGPDSMMGTADDNAYSPSKFNAGLFQGELGKTQAGEKLYWIYSNTHPKDALISCTFPRCDDAKIEFTTTSAVISFEFVSPSLVNKRLALVINEAGGSLLRSCSLSQQDNDFCGKPSSDYALHAVDVEGVKTVRDGGIVYHDAGRRTALFFVSAEGGRTAKTISLPAGTIEDKLARLAPGVPGILFAKTTTNQQNTTVTDISLLDAISGTITPLEEISRKQVYMVFLGLTQNKIASVFGVFERKGFLNYMTKSLGQKETSIGEGTWLREIKQLRSGKMIGMEDYGLIKLVSFDCTPNR